MQKRHLKMMLHLRKRPTAPSRLPAVHGAATEVGFPEGSRLRRLCSSNPTPDPPFPPSRRLPGRGSDGAEDLQHNEQFHSPTAPGDSSLSPHPRSYQQRREPNTTHLKNAKGMKNPTSVNSQGVYVNARVAGSIKTKHSSLGRVCKVG